MLTAMDRRTVLRWLAAAPAAATSPAPHAATPVHRILLQQSPVAGFQHHDGERLWRLLRVGTALRLVREPDNVHDVNAVALHFHRYRIGYLPAMENTAVSQLMDRGERLDARIVALALDPDPWERVRVAVELEIRRG
jgi:hypothetical protein